jgi:hypothetical protein
MGIVRYLQAFNIKRWTGDETLKNVIDQIKFVLFVCK